MNANAVGATVPITFLGDANLFCTCYVSYGQLIY